jgi:hypothetical protein
MPDGSKKKHPKYQNKNARNCSMQAIEIEMLQNANVIFLLLVCLVLVFVEVIK